MSSRWNLAESLPSRADVAEAMGLWQRSHSTDMAMALSAFGAGMMIGAALALLLAPKSGRELRRDLENTVSEMRGSSGGRTEERPTSAEGSLHTAAV